MARSRQRVIFVGDSNSVAPRGGSRRDGYELTVFWQPIDLLSTDAVYTAYNCARRSW